MTGFGYMVMVSSLSAEEFAGFFDFDAIRVKNWCDGREKITEDEEKLMVEELGIRGDALEKQVWELDEFEENMLYIKGVYVGVKARAELHKK